MQDHIILGLASVIENRDISTGEHIARTGHYVKTLAEDARADGVYVVDALISERCYKKAISVQEAVEIIREEFETTPPETIETC